MTLYKTVNGKRVALTAEQEAEVRARWAAEEAKELYYQTNLKYIDDRKAEYPEIGDQLDTLLKQFSFMLDQKKGDIVPEMEALIAEWKAVKEKYPKPTEE